MALIAKAIRLSCKNPFASSLSIVNRNLRMSAQLRAEKALEEMKTKNPYYEKYATKIATLKKEKPSDFESRMEELDKQTKPKKIVIDDKPRNYSELLNPKTSKNQTERQEEKKGLEEIMKLDLLNGKSSDEIQHIWLEYHKQKDVLAAVIPADKFRAQMESGKNYPIFIIPLPRSEGYEFFLLQFAGQSVHFTPLLCYQVHKENAPECLNLIYYTEFKEEKGIILMRGEYDKNVINAKEAQCLANQMQLYYAQNDTVKIELLEQFTKQPDMFSHQDVIKELENLSL